MEQLVCTVQNYDWGRVASESVVGKLSGGLVEAGKPYAEVLLPFRKRDNEYLSYKV